MAFFNAGCMDAVTDENATRCWAIPELDVDVYSTIAHHLPDDIIPGSNPHRFPPCGDFPLSPSRPEKG